MTSAHDSPFIHPYQDTLESNIREAIDTYRRALALPRKNHDADWWLDELTCDVMYSRLQSSGYLPEHISETLLAEIPAAFRSAPAFISIRAMIKAGVE